MFRTMHVQSVLRLIVPTLGGMLSLSVCSLIARGAPIDDSDTVPDFMRGLPSNVTTDDTPKSEPEDVRDQEKGATAPPPAISDADLPPWKRFSGLVEAEKAMRAGKASQAMEHLRDAAAENPYLPPVNVIFAQMLMANNQLAAGRRMLEDAAIEYPENPAVYILFGQTALREGRLNDAQLNFDKAEQFQLPENWPSELHQNKNLAVLRGQALVAERRAQWLQGEAALRRLTMASPTDATIRKRWATALFLTGQEKMAYDEFDRAFRQDNRLDRPEIAIAALYMEVEKYGRATAVYQRALKSHPDDPKVHAEFAGAMLMLGKPTEAKQYAEKAAKLGLDAPEFDMLRGMIASQLGEFAAAEVFFSQVVKASPENIEARCQRAIARLHQSDQSNQAEAMQDVKELIQMYPGSDRAQAIAGWIHYRSGRVVEAEPWLRSAVASGRPHPEAIYYLARYLFENGQRDEAGRLVEALRPLVDQPGHFVRRLEVRQWLNEIDSESPDNSIPKD